MTFFTWYESALSESIHTTLFLGTAAMPAKGVNSWKVTFTEEEKLSGASTYPLVYMGIQSRASSDRRSCGIWFNQKPQYLHGPSLKVPLMVRN